MKSAAHMNLKLILKQFQGYKADPGGTAMPGRPVTGVERAPNIPMIWQPLDLAQACPAHTPMSACSAFGHMYLSLLVQLYGGARDEGSSRGAGGFQYDSRGAGGGQYDSRGAGGEQYYSRGTGGEQYYSRRAGGEQYDSRRAGGEQYDFVVVGAGSAGCVVANRLTENPNWKVLLLEAGPEEPDVTLVPSFSTALLGSNIDWQYSTEPNGKSCLAFPGGRCSWPRGKTMGGSSSINSMADVRGNKVDYDGWASLGNKGWSYEDVLPFFKKSERNLNIEGLDREYHGVKGEQYVSRYPYIDKPSIMMTEAYNQAGLPLVDYNGAQQLGTMQAQTFSLDGERVSTNVAFIEPIRYKRPNIYIETNAEVIKILIDELNNAYGVVYVKGGEVHTAYAKKEVIVSAGTINSPKLLMLSGIGPKQHLESLGIPVVKDLAVGENLQDHITFNGIIVALPNKTATTVSKEELLYSVKEYAKMKIKRGPLSANGPVNSVAFLKTDPYLIAPDIQFQADHAPSWREFIQDPVTAINVAIFPTAYYDAVIPRPMNVVPKSRGVLLLNASYPNGPPLIYPNYFADERDFIPLLRATKFLLTLENTEAFRSNGAYFVREPLPKCKNYEWGTDEYYICLAKQYTSTTYHPVGSCKMGPKWDKKAVVDNELRVYGVGRLRVIDASMMPVVVRGNTNAPAIMIGERGIDFVIKYWERRRGIN